MTSLATLAWCSIAAAVLHCGPRGKDVRSIEARTDTNSVRLERLQQSERGDIYAVRGPTNRERLVFLHGMCEPPDVHLERFKHVVATRGVLVSPSGDAPCPDRRGTTYSTKIEDLDQRILQGFAALNIPAPTDVGIIGYSLGAVRAQELARKFPERYRRLVLIGAPATPEPNGLTHLESAVLLAGERERQDLMFRGSVKLRSAKVPSTFMLLPKAKHGELGPDAERVMAAAIDWKAHAPAAL